MQNFKRDYEAVERHMTKPETLPHVLSPAAMAMFSAMMAACRPPARGAGTAIYASKQKKLKRWKRPMRERG